MRWVWALALGGIFFEAYSSTALGSALEALQRQLALSAFQVSVVTSTSMLVALLLCPVAGRLSDRYGRLPMILLAKVLAVVSTLVAIVLPTFELLVFSRVLAGASWALDFAVVMAYIAEFLPRRHQGRLNRWQGMWYIATTGNLLLTAGVYLLGVGDDIWRWSLGSAGVVALLLGIAQWFTLPESPRWLASQGRVREATRAMRLIYRVEVEMPAADVAPARSGQDGGGAAGLAEMFRGRYRRRTVLAGVTFMMQGLEYYAIGWYLPIIALQLFGAGFLPATLGVVAFNLFGIVGGFGSTSVAARLGIRRSMQLGFAGVAVLVLALGVFFDSLPVWAAVALPAAFLLLHSAGPAPGGASLAALAYPSHLRALGSGLTNTAGSAGAAIGLFVFPLLLAELGPRGAITVTAAAPAIGFLVSTLVRWDPEREPETSDTSDTSESARTAAGKF
ncbi:MFS transporter [Pseudonocardia sp. KRD291]|uniref:MFS transporter n=1 Tax=Pseudonocardia sp. KRD291 TaxID=2792007 RepID=UPI001C49E606|nr:MFS transporter [Pseudonocardia sp. KRD291]MBW0101092.1 MFS transporter [Pseudonocardia sp. KRD291]